MAKATETPETTDTVEIQTQATTPEVPTAPATPDSDEDAADQQPAGPKMVPIKLHKDKHNAEDVFVSVNGEKFLIQRGVMVDVPDYVAEVLDHSERQDNAAMEHREAMIQAYENKTVQ